MWCGWGNHLVVDHGDNIYSRYAHLRFNGIYKKVGQKVTKDEIIGLMGNSGRSDIRHLHLEIGHYLGDFIVANLLSLSIAFLIQHFMGFSYYLYNLKRNK